VDRDADGRNRRNRSDDPGCSLVFSKTETCGHLCHPDHFCGATALNTALKLLLSRPRPSLFTPLVSASGFSFPSGHVTASVATFGFLAVLLWREKRFGWAIASLVLVPLVALSRIYLGVHYPSDVLGSLIFAQCG